MLKQRSVLEKLFGHMSRVPVIRLDTLSASSEQKLSETGMSCCEVKPGSLDWAGKTKKNPYRAWSAAIERRGLVLLGSN